MSGSLPLQELIKERITREGPLNFADFMALALYHPRFGYYMADDLVLGAQGDFYTSVHVSPLFGEMLARQLQEMWHILERPAPFQILEYGAGDGRLAAQILAHAQRSWPDFYQAIAYYIAEISPGMLGKQRENLKPHLAKINWLPVSSYETGTSDDATGPNNDVKICGCIFSNEFIDAMPVHRLVLQDGKIQEIYIDWQEGKLKEVLGKPSSPRLVDYLNTYAGGLEEGQEAEINLAARPWMDEAAHRLKNGFIMTIDYGGLAKEVYHPAHFKGTLRGFYRHTIQDDPLKHIGEQDLTAHVNFSALMDWGEADGLKTTGYTDQMKFLLGLGILDKLKQGQDFAYDADLYHKSLAIKRLIMPENTGMGGIFKVLIQHKGVNRPKLKGLRKLY